MRSRQRSGVVTCNGTQGIHATAWAGLRQSTKLRTEIHNTTLLETRDDHNYIKIPRMVRRSPTVSIPFLLSPI